MCRKPARSGFTLVELLVVMSILVVLASFLFPVVAMVARNARATACVSNEKTICQAILAYTANNNGVLISPIAAWPGSNGVADFTTGLLWQYIAPSPAGRAAVMFCPQDALEQVPTYGGNDVSPPPPRNFSYSLNLRMLRQDQNGGILLSRVRQAALHGMVYEEFAPNDCVCYGPTDLDDWLTGRHGPRGTTERRSSYGDTGYRSSGRGNVGYFDGHVESMTIDKYFSDTHIINNNTYQYYHFEIFDP